MPRAQRGELVSGWTGESFHQRQVAQDGREAPVTPQAVSVQPGKRLQEFLRCFSGIEARLPVAVGDTD